MLIIGGFGSGKTNVLINLIEEQDSDEIIDKIDLYAKDVNEPKYHFLIKKDVGRCRNKDLNDPKAFIEYSTYMYDIHNNIDNFNLTRNRKKLIVF